MPAEHRTSPTASRPVVAIAAGGAVAAVLDILGAFAIYWPAPPAGILRLIAAGVVGSAEARSGGASLAALGLLLHFGVAFTAAAVFVAACRVAPGLARQPWLTGPLYGVVVFLMMNYIVNPAVGDRPHAGTVVGHHPARDCPAHHRRRTADCPGGAPLGDAAGKQSRSLRFRPGLGFCSRPASRPTAGAR